MWVDAVNYCRSKGTAIIASAGNEHVRINKVNLTIGGRTLKGVGQVSSGMDGIASIAPGRRAGRQRPARTARGSGGRPRRDHGVVVQQRQRRARAGAA